MTQEAQWTGRLAHPGSTDSWWVGTVVLAEGWQAAACRVAEALIREDRDAAMRYLLSGYQGMNDATQVTLAIEVTPGDATEWSPRETSSRTVHLAHVRIEWEPKATLSCPSLKPNDS